MATANVFVGAIPALVYQPVTNRDHIIIQNSGNAVAYIGQQYVTPVTGVPLPPGHRFELLQVPGPIYAVSGVGSTAGLLSTSTNALASKGATALPVASGGASYTAGMLLQVNTTSSVETVKVAAGSTSTSIALASGLQYSHASGTAVTQILGNVGTSLNVTASLY